MVNSFGMRMTPPVSKNAYATSKNVNKRIKSIQDKKEMYQSARAIKLSQRALIKKDSSSNSENKL